MVAIFKWQVRIVFYVSFDVNVWCFSLFDSLYYVSYVRQLKTFFKRFKLANVNDKDRTKLGKCIPFDTRNGIVFDGVWLKHVRIFCLHFHSPIPNHTFEGQQAPNGYTNLNNYIIYFC